MIKFNICLIRNSEKIMAENSQELLEKIQLTHMHIDTHIFKVTKAKALSVRRMVI